GQDLHPAPQLPAALAADDVDLTDSSGLTRTPEVMHAYTLGLRAAEGGDSIEALAHFAEALRHDPAFTDAYLAKGNVLRQMQDYVDAVRAYSQALEIDASLAAAYHGRGECYMAMSPPDYNLAIGDFERAVDLDPRNAKARETRNQLRAMAAAEADDTPSREPVEVELRLNANGATSLDGEELTIDEAAERFALLSSDARVRLVAEPTRPYHDIVTWMDALKAAGVSQVDLTLAPGTVGDPSSTPGEAGPRDTPSSATSPLTVKVIQRPLVNGSRVTAYLEVTAHDGSSSLERQREMALVPALLKSDPVLSAAFNRVAPNYKRLREISEEGAAELREQFKVSFVNESPIVELTMPADEEGANLALMSAVIEEVRREISTRAFGAAGDAVATDGNPSPGPSPPGRGAGAPYRIGPGDTLRVRSIGNLPDQVDGTFIVEEEGTIAIGPAYGRVEVTGLTVREAETAVLKTLTAAATAHFGHSEFQPKVQVTLEGKAREARGASGEAREGEIAAAPGGAYLVPSTPGTSTTESPIIPIPDHPSPAGVEVSRLVAIADQFPDGVDESEAKRIVAELKRQGFDAELRMEGDKPMLLVRTQSPHTRFLWEQSTSDGRVVWHCRVVNFDAAGIPPYATGRAAYSDPRGGGGVVYPVSPPGEPAVGSPVAPVVAPPRSDGVPQSVEMLPGMTEDDLKRIADELSGLGFRVTALRRNDGRLMLEFLGLEVKARPVWETRQIGDASGRTRMARTLRLVGPDGRTIAPSNADRGSVPPTTHVLVLEAAKGVERAVAKEFVEKLKEQNLDAELLEWDERLAIGIRNMATGFKPLWETRTKDGQARAFVRFVDDESGLMTMPIDAGLWKPAVRTPEAGAGGMIVPTPGMPSSGAPLLAAPGTSYGPSPALTFGRGETQAVIATPPGTSDADATLIHHELQQQGYRVDLERLGDKSQLRFSLLPAVPKAVWEERLIDGRRVAFLRLLGPDDRDLAPHSNRQLWIPAPLIDGGGVNPSPGPSLQGRGMLEEAEGSDPEVRRAGPTPLYDGKTFEAWRAHWRSELKVAKRMEAVEALAAFARAGHGREAAEALLDVAGEYEFGGGGGGAELLGQIIETLSGRDSDSIATDVWLPVLVERIRLSQGEKQRHWRGLLDAVLRQWSIKHEQPSEQLLALATDETVGVQVAALCALVRETPAFAQGADPRVIALVRRALQGAEPAVELLSDLEFVNLREFPEQLDLLLHEDAKIQTRARQILRQVGRVESPEIVDSLLQVALNDGPAAKRVAAVRALGSMGARLHQRRPSKLIGQLKNLAVTTDEEQLLAPTLFALSLIEGFGDGAAGAGGVVAELKEQHADAITHERLAALQAAVSQMPEEKRQVEGK
ncbi:MAG TPA: tetratricopeptide repeat protein, partial [Lacipirellulaceae bacterium]|nr:tetratricopeptide repeat protein [Lacipirellulaceae bacterium]